ncbi:hypothetical protein LO55_505 [Massilia timonae]|uniref:Uncharacterized protein n=1 Tax=Massilia timonae TaxID=47229 RepID=A0A1S2NBA3_9BURK|nr:hypothetical protein LO55_505 [Massilia timonae]
MLPKNIIFTRESSYEKDHSNNFGSVYDVDRMRNCL